MINNKKKLVSVVLIVLGALLALMPFYIAPVCPVMANGMKMNCYYSGIFVKWVGIAIVLVSILNLIFKKKIMEIIFTVINMILSLSVILIPNKIVKVKIGTMKNGMPRFMSYCNKNTMACAVHHTFTYTTIIASVIFIITLGLLMYIFIKKENVNEK